MGTRNLTTVILNGQTKVAQYGQWDGYPEGQGADILRFLSEPGNVEGLRAVATKVHFEDTAGLNAILAFVAPDLVDKHLLSTEDSERFDKALPALNRNFGGGILQALVEADDPRTYNPKMFVLRDDSSFFEDNIFCEWAYTVDLDKNTLTVFAPPSKLAEFPLDDLPSEEVFVATLNALAEALV